MTEIEIMDAINNARGISEIEFSNNGAWNQFNDYVNNYYSEWMNVDDYSDLYLVAKSIVAWRMHTAWNIASNHNNITLILIDFARLMDDAMRSWARTNKFDMCYEIAVTDMCLPFVNHFGITYCA